MRVDNWDSKLELVIKELKNKEKFMLGKNDCLTFPIECIETITGIKVFNNKYKSLNEAKKILKKMKSKDILDVALESAKKHNFKEIDIDKAQKGDVLYYTSKASDFNGTLGICIGESVMFNWKKAITLIPKNNCKIAWRIE
jgi:hypothetical protein